MVKPRLVHPFAGKRTSSEQDVCLEKQLERFEWQLRILKEVLSANGNPERAELLKDHADADVCALVLSILDKVRTRCDPAVMSAVRTGNGIHPVLFIWR